jgi:signal transduction histidine kinase
MGGRDGFGVAAAGMGAVSLAFDAVLRIGGGRYRQGMTTATALAIAEIAMLLTLTVLAVRRSRAGVAVAAGVLAGLAVPLWLLRFGPPAWSAESAGGYTAWGTLPVLAILVGWYLRALDRRRTRAVAAARRVQRLELADDLHDFVVHDVNEMLLQAQAGQVLLDATGGDREGAADVRDVLRRIEQAALGALRTVDRTVHLLHHDDGSRRSDVDGAVRLPQPMMEDLPELVGRFTATGPVMAELDLAPGLVAATGDVRPLPSEVSTTVYRIAVEALTNVRRHATGAGRVRVTVDASPGGGVRVEVTDDGAGGRPTGSTTGRAPRTGGLGLAGLAARVEALGGTLNAGPAEPRGWRVSAVLPGSARRIAADPRSPEA